MYMLFHDVYEIQQTSTQCNTWIAIMTTLSSHLGDEGNLAGTVR